MDMEYGAEGMCVSNHTTLCVEECHLHAATLLWCGEVSESLGSQCILGNSIQGLPAANACVVGRSSLLYQTVADYPFIGSSATSVNELAEVGSQCCVVGTYNGGKNQEA